MVLFFNSRLKLFPGKLKSKWYDPFTIKEVRSYGVVELEDLVSKIVRLLWTEVEAISWW